MKRIMKCLGCGHKFELDIPEVELKSSSWFESSRSTYLNSEFERALIDVRDLTCPRCKRKGTIQAEYRKIDEKIIRVNSKENFILSLLYPWSFKPSKIHFQNGYQYYMAHFLNVGDYTKITEMSNRESIDKYIRDYPEYKKKKYFDKIQYLRNYLNKRVTNDEKFRKKLLEYDGYKIEFEDKDTYLGYKYTKEAKTGKNIYGKLLTEYAVRVGDEEEI